MSNKIYATKLSDKWCPTKKSNEKVQRKSPTKMFGKTAGQYDKNVQEKIVRQNSSTGPWSQTFFGIVEAQVRKLGICQTIVAWKKLLLMSLKNIFLHFFGERAKQVGKKYSETL